MIIPHKQIHERLTELRHVVQTMMHVLMLTDDLHDAGYLSLDFPREKTTDVLPKLGYTVGTNLTSMLSALYDNGLIALARLSATEMNRGNLAKLMIAYEDAFEQIDGTAYDLTDIPDSMMRTRLDHGREALMKLSSEIQSLQLQYSEEENHEPVHDD